MRKLYFAALMHQDISWYDVRDPAALPMEFNDDINKFSEAFSDQLGNMVFALSGTVSCVIAAFVIGWQIALVICSTTPAIAVGVFFMMQSIDTMMNETQGWYSRAAVVVEECLGGMRTVVAFGRERFELNNYEVHSASAPFRLCLGLGRISSEMVLSSFFCTCFPTFLPSTPPLIRHDSRRTDTRSAGWSSCPGPAGACMRRTCTGDAWRVPLV